MKLLLIFLITFGCVYAQENPIDKKMNECIKNLDSSTPEIECISTAIEEWDNELNKVYKELMKKLKENVSEEAANKLQEAQREWIKYKDKELEFVESFHWEVSMNKPQLQIADIKKDILKNRTIELQNYLDQIY